MFKLGEKLEELEGKLRKTEVCLTTIVDLLDIVAEALCANNKELMDKKDAIVHEYDEDLAEIDG